MQALGRKVRRRNPESVCKEIEMAIERWRAHTFNFADEIFLFNDKRTKDFLKMMINRGIAARIRWSALTRANLVNEKIIKLGPIGIRFFSWSYGRIKLISS